MVASWSAYVFLSHLKRNVRASMVIRKQFGFPCKEESRVEVAHSYVVDIHHHVLKSTTSAGAVRDSRLVDLVSLVALVYLVSLIQPNERDKPNKPDEPSIAFGPGAEVLLLL